MSPLQSISPRVAVVGGGLAGLAAALALCTRGCSVELFEARRKLGGRAGSYTDTNPKRQRGTSDDATSQSIDHCQHVAMGCCTNYLDFCRLTGIDHLLTRHHTLHFFSREGARSDFSPSRWLPAPLHLVGPLFKLSYLSIADKISIARAMLALVRTPPADALDAPTVLAWLRDQRQSQAAIDRFWKVILVSALAESLDRASLGAARKVFVDGFLANRQAADVLVPRVSLDELYDQRVAAFLTEHGVTIRRETPVGKVDFQNGRASGIQLPGGASREFDFLILTVPWTRIKKLIPEDLLQAIDPHNQFSEINAAPITSAHLWFDRPITDLPHGVIVGRLSQWLFSRALPGPANEHYYQVVISASHDLAQRERQSIIDEVTVDLAAVFPAARLAKLLRWQLITDPAAVFSVRPGLDAIRPPQQTSISNLLLAGDWTKTGWPATMEGAVRSGYLAAEAVLSQLSRPEKIVAADLPRSWLTASLC